jgi:phospholipase/lecithinase/hemolysin
VFVTAGGNDLFALLDQLAAGAAAAGKAAADETFASVLIAQLSGCACDRAAASAAIQKAMLAELARPGHTDESVVQVAVAVAAKQPGNAAVADPAVYGPMVAKAKEEAAAAGAEAGARYAADHGPDAVNGMAAAAAELAALVKNRVVGNGANFVVVNNLPDAASSPGALAQPASTQALIKAMVNAFNDQLRTGLNNEAKVQLVDLYALTHDQAANPAQYGLTVTTKPACGPNQLGGLSLICTLKNTVPGDVSHYMFADNFHPTPYEHSLVARYIWHQMAAKGWL